MRVTAQKAKLPPERPTPAASSSEGVTAIQTRQKLLQNETPKGAVMANVLVFTQKRAAVNCAKIALGPVTAARRSLMPPAAAKITRSVNPAHRHRHKDNATRHVWR
jgi:hypothetical protein